jgi:hypothetical protein
LKKGDWINTPRFCKVQIVKVFKSRATAYKQGFNEPTDYSGPESWKYDVLGKNTGTNTMIFAAVEV